MLPSKLYNYINSFALWKVLSVFFLYIFTTSILFTSSSSWINTEILYLLIIFSSFTILSHFINLLLFKHKFLLSDAIKFTIVMHVYSFIYASIILIIKLFYPRFFQPVHHFISDGVALILITFPVYILAVTTVFFKVKYNIALWKTGSATIILLYGAYFLVFS